MRDVFVTAAATRMVMMSEITVRGIRRARSSVDAHMMRLFKQAKLTLFVAALVLAGVAALSFLSINDNEAEAATTITVLVKNNFFQSSSIQINVGDTVQWLDGQAFGSHTVTQCTGNGTGCPGGTPGFDSGVKSDPASAYLTQAFPNEGTFFYRCQIHGNSMSGTITVVSPTTPTPTPVPTPTPTPLSVGGIADFPDVDESPADAPGSSGGSSFPLALLVSGLLIALAAVAGVSWHRYRRRAG